MTSAQVSNQKSLDAAVEAAATFLNGAVKPVLVAGGHLRTEKAMGAFAGNCTNALCTLNSFNLSKGQKRQGLIKALVAGGHMRTEKTTGRKPGGLLACVLWTKSSVRGGAWLAR